MVLGYFYMEKILMQMQTNDSSRPYSVEWDNASQKTRASFEDIISKGADEGEELIDMVMSSIPRDMLANTNKMDFGYEGDSLLIDVGDGKKRMMHQNAVTQIATKTGILSKSNVNHFFAQGDWGKELLCRNLQEIYQKINTERLLIRNIDNTVMAALSDKYMIVDTVSILSNLLETLSKSNAVVVGAYFSDLKWWIRLVVKEVFEPVKNEVVMYGLQISNSDFGQGALEIKNFIVRLWCSNLATRDVIMRNVHLGKQLPVNIEWAKDTIEANSKTISLKARDFIANALQPRTIDASIAKIAEAHEAKVDVEKYLKGAIRSNITKEECSEIKTIYNNTSNIELLPSSSGGDNKWRLSNAFSLVAKSKAPDRREALESKAGELLA